MPSYVRYAPGYLEVQIMSDDPKEIAAILREQAAKVEERENRQ
ncbi:hypothetical protein ACT3TP_16155 [Glutamicibacter sp. AOP38-B1-38]